MSADLQTTSGPLQTVAVDDRFLGWRNMEATCDRMYSYAMRVGRLLASNAKGKAAVEVARRVDVAAYISRMQSGILQSYDAVRRVPWGSWATEKSLIFSSSCAHNAPCNRVHTYVMGGVSQVERYFYFSNATVTSAASRSLDVVSPFVSFFHQETIHILIGKKKKISPRRALALP